MWLDHFRVIAVWILFFGIIMFTALVGEIFAIFIVLGLFGIIGSLFYAIHVTYDWIVLYTERKN